MKYSTLDANTYLIKLEKDEKVVESLKNFCKTHTIINASFNGIGSVEDPLLAHYQVSTKKYSEKKLHGVFEVTSLLGNIALFEEEPLIHAHITLGDEEMKVFGGHLVETIVSATLEIIVTKFDTKYSKRYDNTIGLKLWELANH